MRKKLLALILTIAMMVPSMGALAADKSADETVVVETTSATYDAAFTGLAPDGQGRFLLYVNGKWQNQFSGFYFDAQYGWWLITNGVVNFAYTDLYGDATFGWWKVVGGTVDFNYTGWYKSPALGTTWYVYGGAVDLSKGCQEMNATSACQFPMTGKGATQTETEFVYRVLELVNQERAKAGIQPLSFNQAILDCAQLRATECVTRYGHTRPDGSSCFTAFTQCGVPSAAWAENVAAGQRSPEAVVNAWMNSDGHRKNIMNPTYNYIGIGCKQSGSGYGIYWAQCFSAK
ncbi:MAG: CAP domain-containing protein [Lachnospiraceae bacterium]|nr:CAP domain-containing protein [Lachnospiraceae bacterium]